MQCSRRQNARAAFLILFAASTRARIIPARSLACYRSSFFVLHPCHDIGWRSLLAEFRGHKPHVWIDVLEESLVPRAEIVQAGLAFGSPNEAVLGALSIAGESDLAFTAIARQRVEFVLPELVLLRRAHQRPDRVL